MIDEQQIALLRAKYGRVKEVTELLNDVQRLLAIKHAADPFIEFSHDPDYWQKHGTEAYEALKAALFYYNQSADSDDDDSGPPPSSTPKFDLLE